MESVGFKEWSIVCEALGRGDQSVILRKGGIAEGREGFSFRYREFFLFPTWFHEQAEKVRRTWEWSCGVAENAQPRKYSGPSDGRRPTSNAQRSTHRGVPMPQGKIEIRFAAKLDVCRTIVSWPVAQALEPLHILKPEVVHERFDYDQAPGLHVALLRIFRVVPTWSFPDEKRYGGCRSWVKLPEAPADLRFEPVLSDAEQAKRREEFLEIVRG
jgi:hypothetical protein